MKLNKNKVYDLSELTSEERNELYEHLCNLQEELKLISVDEYDILEYKTYNEWCYWHKENSIKYKYTTHNAKELFYTLENVQVDCRELSEEQIKEMADIFEANGYDNSSIGLEVKDIYFLLRQRWGKEDRNFGVLGDHKDGRFITITYDKFMELFAPKYEVKYIAEQPKEDKPTQYQIGIDTFQRCESNMTKEEILACCKFNIDKYNWRNKGQDLEDLEKIIAYSQWAIKQLADEK